MIKALALITSTLMLTPTILTREIWTCEQVGAWGYNGQETGILNSYDGMVMSLDFDTTSNDLYNPLRNNPIDSTTNYHFYIDIDLTNYVDERGDLFPYYIMSYDSGNSWQQVPINDDNYSLNLYCTYSDLETIRIMYNFNVNHGDNYYSFEHWQVTFYQESAFADITSEEYQSGYNTGYQDGYQNGDINGYNIGYGEGYYVGYNVGANTDITTNGVKTMFNTIMSYPINFLKTAFNFEIFGINLSALIMFILSCGIVLYVVNKFRK